MAKDFISPKILFIHMPSTTIRKRPNLSEKLEKCESKKIELKEKFVEDETKS